MANGNLTVKQAIDNDLEGKEQFTIEDTVKCIKHIAQGLDNLECSKVIARVSALEVKVKWHQRVFGALYTITIGAVIALTTKLGKWS